MEFNAIIVRKYQNFIKCIEWDVFSGGTSGLKFHCLLSRFNAQMIPASKYNNKF